MSAQPPVPTTVPQKPALATAGVTVGGAGGSVLVGLLVARLSSATFTWANDWQGVSALVVGLVVLYGWAWLTARKDSVQTGLSLFDRPKNGGGGG